MASLLVYVLGFLAFFALVCVFSRYLQHRAEAAERFAEPPFVALRSPSRTNAFDRRIEVALRDASRGFRLCSKCLFTNRARAECCVLCGSTLRDEEPGISDEHTSSLTQRQRRARTRKQWVRRVDEGSGNIVWSHNHDDHALAYPYYVLRVGSPSARVKPLRDPVEGQEPVRLPVSISSDVAVRIDEPVATTLDDVSTSLHSEMSTCSCEWTAVTDGSAAPLQVHFDMHAPTAFTSTELKDAVVNAAVDFPTKLAQFVTSTSTVFVSAALNDDGTTLSTRLSIQRDALIHTSIDALATMTRKQARAAIRVDFVGEQGIDAGGVYREWFVLLNERILAPEAGLFTCVDTQTQVYYLNPHSREMLGENHLAHFYAVGRLFGRALLEGNVTGFHLALPLLKIMLGLPIGFPDLEYFDSELHANLQWLLDSDDVDTLGLDFSVVEQFPDGTVRIVELVPDGSALDVTNATKHEFVDRKLKYLLVDRVRPQLLALVKGLYEVVPPELLVLLDTEELDYLLAGCDDINVDDWQRSSQNSGNLLLHPALPNFWRVVRELSLDERRRLLQFATGATRVPPGGFSALTSYDGRQCAFTLHGVAVWRSLGYLRSHACFNRLDLPMHVDLVSMRRAVAAAIAVDSFGFTAS